jgi:hypothetical protein
VSTTLNSVNTNPAHGAPGYHKGTDTMSNAENVIALVARVAQIKGHLAYWVQAANEFTADLQDTLSELDDTTRDADYMADLHTYYDDIAGELQVALNERDHWRGLLVKTLASIAHAIPPAPRA